MAYFSSTRGDIMLPTQSSSMAAGWDLYSPQTAIIEVNEFIEINTHVKISTFPPGTFGKIEGRSGLGRRGITPFCGVIDPDYEGELSVILENRSKTPYTVNKGDKIAQLIFNCAHITTDTSQRIRGDAGFGSSGR